MESNIKKPSLINSLRYHIMILGLISPFVTTYSRTIINFAIIDMVNPAMIVKSKPNINEQLLTPLGTNLTNDNAIKQYYFDLDGSCSVNDDDRQRLIGEASNNLERKLTGQAQDKYDWDTFQQGLLKSAYAIGHAPFQVPGSRLAEIYGSHRIMSLGTFFIGLCCLLAPYLASINFYLIFCDLIILGTIGSFMTPALINLLTNWLTPSEKSIMMSLYLVASRLGYALSSMLCGLLINAQYSWRHVFFSAGFVSLTYSTFFFICARSRPIDHPLIKDHEINYLASKNKLVAESMIEGKVKVKLNDGCELKSVSIQAKCSNTEQHENITIRHQKKSNKAPWVAIFTSVPVWAFITTKFCVKLAGDAVQIELPSYLSKVMHFTASSNGFINASNYVIFCVSAFGVGALGKVVMKKQPFGLSKTKLRKCFQCFASFGVSLTLIGIALSVCNSTLTQLFLMLYFFFTTFGVAGEAQIPIDITDRYSGTIHAIGSSLAISGIIEPTIVGFFLRGHAADQNSWQIVWLVASAIAFFGGLVFLLFADATIQPFDSIHFSDSTDKEEITPTSDGVVNVSNETNPKPNKQLQCYENKAFQREVLEVKKKIDKTFDHKESRVI